MKSCPVCGARIQDYAAFCPDCGSRVETPESPAQSAAQAVLAAEPPAAPGYVPPWREPETPPAPETEPPRQETGAPYAAPPYAQSQPPYGAAPQQKDWNRPLSTWAYALSLFLMGLPVVGFILQIVWAVGGTSSVNRQNLARGYLFLRVCLIVLVLLLGTVLLAIVAPYLHRIASEFGRYYNFFY